MYRELTAIVRNNGLTEDLKKYMNTAQQGDVRMHLAGISFRGKRAVRLKIPPTKAIH
jgi:hypothetical protein